MFDLQEETRLLMKKYRVTANKKLGQNFLVNEEVIDKIIFAANLTDEDLVIEIGPGLGTLTSRLIKKAGKVIAVELDENMLRILQDRFKFEENFELIHQDILKVKLNDLIENEKKPGKIKNVKVVANLPYYITTPIIMKLLEDKLDIESITVMVQKEVADRLVAIPGDKLAGAITYTVNYYTQSEQVIFVPRDSFIPSPDVDSAVIKLNIRKEVPVQVDDEQLFFSIIKASFMQRRKTLRNGLINANIFNKDEIDEVFENCDLQPNCRGENLTMNQFALLANYKYRNMK